MLIYEDLLSGDELLSDSYEVEEVHNGIFYQVKGKWITTHPVDVNIGANASAEGGEDESVDDSSAKVVDIIEAFRLQEQPSFDKKGFMSYIKGYIQKLTPKLPADRQAQFKTDVQAAVKFLLSKLSDLQFFVGQAQDLEGAMVYAYYEEGASEPTFLYFKDGLKEVKC